MNGADNEVDTLAKILWDYHYLGQSLEKADCITVFGSYDMRVAAYGAELFLKGYAPRIIFSGGNSRKTKEWRLSEAATFAERALAMGVPREHILLEEKSTNTGENIQFSKALLKERDLPVKKVLFVQKPYMERRLYAAIKKQWPEVEAVITSPRIPFEEWMTSVGEKAAFISSMVSDLKKIIEYPAKGFQIPQEVPEGVLHALNRLTALGFDK